MKHSACQPPIIPPILRSGALAWFLMAVLLLTGCAGPHPIPEDQAALPALPEAFTASGEDALPARWWRHFDDPELDRLIEQALRDNFSVRAAAARLQQARAGARAAGADRVPSLDASAGASATRETDVDSVENWTFGLAAAYEIDLWGRIGAGVDAAEFDAQASAAALQTARISLSAEVATTYYQWLEANSLIELLQAQRRTNEQVLSVVELRFRNGLANADEVLRQRQLLQQTEAEVIAAEADAGSLRQRLAVLLGQWPGALPLAAGQPVVVVPPLPDTGLPSLWLQRRPDLQQAFLQLQAADARVAVAVAERYPRIDLSASLRSAADSPSDLFSTWVSSLAGNVLLPLLDGGARRAAVARNQAAREEALQAYGQAVVDAAREVEQALLASRRDRAQLDLLEARAERGELIVEQLRLRYVNGSADYLEVLSALDSQQSLARQLLAARWAQVQNRITLARALAGHWAGDRDDDSVSANLQNH